MSPTPAEPVAATLTPPDVDSSKTNNNKKYDNSYEAAATAASTERLSDAQTKSDSDNDSDSGSDSTSTKETQNELNEDLPPPPQLGTSRLGSDVLWMTPDQVAEAYAKAVNERENSANNSEENVKRGRSFNWQSIVKKASAFRDRLLYAVGKILLFILHLDMHGGNTGNNIKFVEGLIDFLAGSIGECFFMFCFSRPTCIPQ